MKIRSDMLLVGLIILGGFLLRMIGINYGLPGIYHPDEPIVVSRAVDLVINGKWNPKFFHWPSLLIYLLALEYEIVYFFGFIIGKFRNLDDFFRFYLLDKGDFHLWGRVLVSSMSSMTGYYVYQILRITNGHKAGIIGLIMTESALLFVKHGQFVTPDIPAVFFSSIALFYLAKYIFQNENRNYVLWAGVFIGLSAGMKYNFALILVPLLIICLTNRKLSIRQKILLAIYSPALAALVFLATNPFIIIDYKTFIFQFNEISRHLAEGHIGMESGRHPSLDLIIHLYKSSGFLFILTALAGIYTCERRNLIWAIALLSFPVILIASHGRWPVTADRYSVPLVIFTILFSSDLLGSFLTGNRILKVISYVLAAAITIQFLSLSITQCIENTKTDTREVARKWIEANIPSGSKIGIEKNGPTLQHAASEYKREPSYYYFDILPWFSTNYRGDDPLKLILENQPEYVITNSVVFARYEPGSPAETQFPDVVKVWRRYYNALDKYGKVVFEVKPDKKTTGPIVRIYKIPGDLYSSLELQK